LRVGPLLRKLACAGALTNFFLSAMGAVEIVFLVRVVGLSSGWVEALIALGRAGGLAGSAVASRAGARYGMASLARNSVALTPPNALLMALTYPGPAVACFAVADSACSQRISKTSSASDLHRQVTL